MKPAALGFLACPSCAGSLTVDARRTDGEEILEGALACTACTGRYPVVRGVPRLAGELHQAEADTAAAFGYEWTRYRELAERYRQQFLDWIRPVDPGFLKGRTVLEGGCGKGRHTAVVAELGARAIVAIDLSDAVDAAFENTRHLPNVHIVQADLNHLPVRRVFDYAFSIGVLHHMPDPERGFRALVSRLVPGGAISTWVYGREGNGWIVHLVSPVRERVTTRLPHAFLDALSGVLTVPLFLATRFLYGPSRSTAFGKRLPYAPYLGYIAPFPFREQRSIVFDHLVAPIAFYMRRDEVAGWFERAGLTAVRIEHHNANSWRGYGVVSNSPAD